MFGVGIAGASLGIGLTVYLNDKFTQTANSVNRSFSTLGDNANRVMKENLQSVRRLATWGSALGVGLLYGFKKFIDAGSEFESHMISVKAIAGSTQEEFELLSRTALNLSRTFPYTALEIGAAMREFAKAGLNTKEIQYMTRAVLTLGTAAELAIQGEAGAANMLVNIMAAFQKSAKDANNVVDILQLAANKTTVDIQNIYEALKYSGSDFRRLGFSLEQATAFISMLGQTGLKGTIGGTTASNFIRYLSRTIGPLASKKQKWGLASLGLSPQDLLDSQGNMKRLDYILAIFADRINRVKGGNDRQSLVESIFGVRGSRATVLLNMLKDPSLGISFTQLLKQLESSSVKGTAMEILRQKMEALKNQFQLIKNAWVEFKIAFFDAVKPLLQVGVPIILKLLHAFTNFIKTPIGKFFTIAFVGFTIMGTGIFMIIAALATLRLSLWATTLGWASMGKMAKWSLAQTFLDLVGITKLGGILKTISLFKGLRWSASMARWITAGGDLASSVPLFGKMGQFIGKLISMGGIFKIFGNGIARIIPLLARFAGPWGMLIGLIVSALGPIAIFKYALGELRNVILWLTDIVTFNWAGAGDRFMKRQENLDYEYYRNTNKPNESMMNDRNRASESRDFLHRKEDVYLKQQLRPIMVNIHIDGKRAIQKQIDDSQDNDITTHLSNYF